MGIPRSSIRQGCSLEKGKAFVLLGVDGSLFLVYHKNMDFSNNSDQLIYITF